MNLSIIHSLHETYLMGKSCLSTCPSIYLHPCKATELVFIEVLYCFQGN